MSKDKESIEASAFHAKHKDGMHHIVGLGNIRVIIVPEDGGGYFAQAIDIDYAAQGESLDDVKKRFETGLTATIEEHLRIHDTIEKFLVPAHPRLWFHFLPDAAALHGEFFCVTNHTIQKTGLPYTGIDYLVAKSVASAAA